VLVEVLCFAAARDAVGAARLPLELQAGATVGTAVDLLVERRPALGPLVVSLRFAVAAEFVAREQALQEGDTLALLPPVSGG
jgi:molybdopterin converting factor small subunit